MYGTGSFVGDALVQMFLTSLCPNLSLFLRRIIRRTSINQDKSLRTVVVCVLNFEKALYFPGLPNNNEMEIVSCKTEFNLFINLYMWHSVWFFSLAHQK